MISSFFNEIKFIITIYHQRIRIRRDRNVSLARIRDDGYPETMRKNTRSLPLSVSLRASKPVISQVSQLLGPPYTLFSLLLKLSFRRKTTLS